VPGGRGQRSFIPLVQRGARRAGCDSYYDVAPVGYSQKKNEEWKMKCTNGEIEEPKNGRMK